ncbi:hypothetical protein [uncultured Deinococcus sp.]|uniref:hypothetical protein n=1 Tax=uncultured Deinococcus sp. TaxID=158789 RepID=UPI00258D51F1|nr:hypothetical protein [uncultured Deinococcus sp.]
MPKDQTPGERGYTAYRESLRGRTWNDQPMPMWDDLPPRVKCGWEANAAQVRRDALEEVTDLIRRAHGELGL